MKAQAQAPAATSVVAALYKRTMLSMVSDLWSFAGSGHKRKKYSDVCGRCLSNNQTDFFASVLAISINMPMSAEACMDLQSGLTARSATEECPAFSGEPSFVSSKQSRFKCCRPVQIIRSMQGFCGNHNQGRNALLRDW
jgi:hypothetical protein